MQQAMTDAFVWHVDYEESNRLAQGIDKVYQIDSMPNRTSV